MVTSTPKKSIFYLKAPKVQPLPWHKRTHDHGDQYSILSTSQPNTMETLSRVKLSTVRLPHLSTVLTHLQTRIKDELERKLQRIHHKLQVALKELQPQRKWSNFSHADKKVIKELKVKNYICLPSDNGTEFCVIQQDAYKQVALAHLSCSNTYQKVPCMSAKTVENKINSTRKKIRVN